MLPCRCEPVHRRFSCKKKKTMLGEKKEINTIHFALRTLYWGYGTPPRHRKPVGGQFSCKKNNEYSQNAKKKEIRAQLMAIVPCILQIGGNRCYHIVVSLFIGNFPVKNNNIKYKKGRKEK